MKSATLVAGIGWGDEGKGATVDALCRRLPDPLVVRYNGGPQAAHNVWMGPGHSHTFSQFGAGTLAGAPTHLSRFMLVNPVTWVPEHRHVADLVRDLTGIVPRTTVEEDAVVITPYHRALNRARERARGRDAHGTTGHGVGEAVRSKLDGEPYLTVGDLRSPTRRGRLLGEIGVCLLNEIFKLGPKNSEDLPDDHLVRFGDAVDRFLQKVLIVDQGWLAEQEASLIFEGAQGVLLDQDYGFHPHTTWSDTTFGNAEVLLEEIPEGPVTKLGVLRSYMTRHGAGPFPTEDPSLDLFSSEWDNNASGWAGAWRVGHPDLVMWRYAIDVLGGVDALSLTHLDMLHKLDRYAYGYDVDGQEYAGLNPMYLDPDDYDQREALTQILFRAKPLYSELPGVHNFVEWIEAELGASVLLRSNGRTAAHRTWMSPRRAPGAMVSPFSRRAETVPASLLN